MLKEYNGSRQSKQVRSDETTILKKFTLKFFEKTSIVRIYSPGCQEILRKRISTKENRKVIYRGHCENNEGGVNKRKHRDSKINETRVGDSDVEIDKLTMIK